VSNL